MGKSERISRLTFMALFGLMLSALRILALSGNIKQPLLLSGKIDVFQTLLPMVALTGNEPNPRCMPAKLFFIFVVSALGTDTKYQAASPGYTHTLLLNL